MKKQTKFVAVLSAAALLAMGASMTSFAAGWEKDEAGVWHYYDSSDDMVTNEWKKDGNKWFYLDDDGAMVTNQWVESDYYVGEDGAMVVNGWVKALPDDEDVDNPEDTGEHWYYFGAKGKKITDQKKNIGGKTYYFNDEGEMRSGWQEIGDAVYYLGTEDEGWATKSKWRWLEKSGIDDDEDDEVTGHAVLGCTEDDDCDDEGWYWFDAAGKMYHGSGLKTINGKKFMFNDHGQMLYEWLNNAEVSVGSNAQLDSNLDDASKGQIGIENMLWFQENGDGASNGARVDGWQYISGSKGTDTEGDTNWYFIKKGKAKYASSAKYANDVIDNNGKVVHKKGDIINNENDLGVLVAADDQKDWTGLMDGKNAVYRMKEKLTWSGKSGTFCFDQNGKMKTGLQYIGGKTYFFNDDGYMQTGKVSNVEESDGDSFNYYFNTKNSNKGQGFTGEKDGYLYFNGKRLEADDDYRIYRVKGKNYVVNNKGKLQKTFNKKDLELADGTVKEDVTLSIDKKTYVIQNATLEVKKPTDSEAVKKAKDAANKVANDYNNLVADNAVLPHIQLEDTDNYIIGTINGTTKVLSVADTKSLKSLDIITGDAAQAKGVPLGTPEDEEDEKE